MIALLHRFTAPPKVRQLLALDLGSGEAVRSVVVAGEGPSRIVRQKLILPLPPRPDDAGRETAIRAALAETLERQLLAPGRPQAILIGLGNRFTASIPHTLGVSRLSPGEPLELQEPAASFQAFLAAQASRVIAGAPHALAHVTPFGLTLDGRALASLPPGAAGERMEIQLLATFASDPLVALLAEFRASWPGLDVELISNQTAIAAAASQRLKASEALFINIGAAATELWLTAGGSIPWTGRIPLGGEDVTRAVAASLGLPFPEAERLKRQLGTAPPPGRWGRVAAAAAAEAAEAWLAALRAEMRTAPQPLPRRLWLLGGGALLPPITRALWAGQQASGLGFIGRPDIRRLNAEDLLGGITFRNAAPVLRGPAEAALAALALRLASTES